MLRYFYLLCLLVCIQWTFCYEFISDDNYRPITRLRKDSRVKHRRHKVDEGRQKRHEYGMEDREAVAQIDVASFLEKPEYDSVEDSDPYDGTNKMRRRTSKDYGDYDSVAELNLEGNVGRRNQNYLNTGSNNPHNLNTDPEYKDLINQRHINLNAMAATLGINPEKHENKLVNRKNEEKDTDEKSVHMLEKKSSLKQVSFPFFSHKISEEPKLKKFKKKTKKRNFFLIGNHKKENTTRKPKSTQSNRNEREYNFYKVNKRSYEECLCPLCKKKFKTIINNDLDNSNAISKKFVHNSRQFYQNIDDIARATSKIELLRNEEDKYTNTDLKKIDDGRRKRQNTDRERQLKELEDVQKRIDGVKIMAPQYYKSLPGLAMPNFS